MEFLPCILRLLTLHMSLFLSPGACLEPYEEELHSLLSPSLTHYTTLHPHSLTHTLHGSQSQPHHSRLVEFHTLERHFQLYLRPNYRIFSSGFKVRSMDRHGNLKEHEVDRTQYYQGVMGGEDGSLVNAHISESGLMTASVTTPTETYHFEPSDNFLTRPHPPHMIAYRSSDAKRDRFNQTRFDFVVAPPLPPGVQTDHTETISNYQRDHAETVADHQRLKRQSRIGGSSCPMFLVVDHRFFNQFRGDGQDLTETIAGITRRLITLVAQVDSSIYRPTVWVLNPLSDNSGSTVTDIGLEIAEILVHHEPSFQDFFTNSTTYYNNPGCCSDIDKPIDADGLLSAFNYGSWDGYCLAHLFTFVNFKSGLLGLANIASSFQSQTGGVCSKAFTDSSIGKRIIYNTGISSFTSGGIPIVRGEQILVVAHEVGHNWGSHHDDRECSGSYLMNEFAQDGSSPSHSMFSSCSRTSIGQVLKSKATCFRDPDPCGNFVIDDVTEECDEGPIAGPCCTSDCQLRDGAMCSDTNSACCTECEIASEDVVCNEAGSFSTNCSIDIHCNGGTPECPDIDTTNMALHGSSCLTGRCKSIGNNLTVCVDFCAFNGTTTCPCPSQNDECKLCCQREGGACEISDDNINLPTGTHCSTGFCIGGECREVQDTISRVFSFITNLDVDDFVLFMEENIVGFTIIFSLILWIPAALVLHCCYDRKVWMKFKVENTDFIRAHTEEEPLIDDRGELGSHSTSPVDDSSPPPYYPYHPPRLETLHEEDEEEDEEEEDEEEDEEEEDEEEDEEEEDEVEEDEEDPSHLVTLV